MAMMLKPPPAGTWLDPEEVLRRFRSEFNRAESFREGVDSYIDRLSAGYRHQGHAALADRIASLKSSGVAVVISDGSPPLSVMFILLPNVPLMAGFTSPDHLEAIQPMLQRCAQVLGYDLK